MPPSQPDPNDSESGDMAVHIYPCQHCAFCLGDADLFGLQVDVRMYHCDPKLNYNVR